MKTEKIILLETSLDHLTGEELGQALEMLNGMNIILDALYLPGTGKKNRPAGLLQVMCRPGDEAMARDAVFRHTHALGLRRQELERYVLPRRACTVEVAERTIAAKAHEIENQVYVRPEADAIRRLTQETGIGAPGFRFRKT